MTIKRQFSVVDNFRHSDNMLTAIVTVRSYSVGVGSYSVHALIEICNMWDEY